MNNELMNEIINYIGEFYRTLECLSVTLLTNSFNIQEIYVVLTLCLRVILRFQ